MKRILLIALIFTTLYTSLVSAKEFNEDRWQWFYSNSDYTGRVDLNTLSYDPETDTAKVWAVWLKTTGIQELIEYRIRFRSNTLDLGENYQYRNGSDTVIEYNSYGWRSQAVPPGSGSEAMVASVKALVGRDAKQAELQEAKMKEMELKKKQQEQQRIAKEKSEKKDKNSQTVSDVLDLIFNW